MPRQRKPRVLIVLAEKDFCEVIQFVYEANDYEVRVAPSGASALELLEGKQLPDLIILDQCLPVYDGFDVCQRLRKRPQAKAIPVIMILVSRTDFHRDLAHSSGATDLFVRPLNPDRLLERSSELLGTKAIR